MHIPKLFKKTSPAAKPSFQLNTPWKASLAAILSFQYKTLAKIGSAATLSVQLKTPSKTDAEHGAWGNRGQLSYAATVHAVHNPDSLNLVETTARIHVIAEGVGNIAMAVFIKVRKQEMAEDAVKWLRSKPMGEEVEAVKGRLEDHTKAMTPSLASDSREDIHRG